MEEAKSIEALSLAFTAGVVAGTMSCGMAPWAGSALLFLVGLPFLFRSGILSLRQEAATALLLGIFLLLGVFCAWSSRFAGIGPGIFLKAVADDAATALRAHIRAIPFPDPRTVPLLLALLTGDRSALPAGLATIFRSSGASHLLALSGLHMGIIYLLLDKVSLLAGRTPAMRKVRYAAILSAAGFFTLMTGASPSLVRAFLFIGINETLRILGRPRKAVRVLCLALLVQLVLDPSVISSVGFQLSYLAMTGIFVLYPVLEKWYPAGLRWDPMRRIWQGAALSISCQACTAPLAWLRFHSFPRYFLLTNLLALPLTTALMGCAVCTVTLEAAGACPTLLVTLTDSLCRLLLYVLEIIASM